MSSEQADRDVKQQTDAARDGRTRDAYAAVRDVTVTHQGPAAAEEPRPRGRWPARAASHQVVVGGIPREPPGFEPRDELLAELDRTPPGAPMVHVMTGMPGAGKTHLAAKYARIRLAAGRRLVAWVDARDEASLLAGLAAIADAAGLSGGTRMAAGDGARTVRRRLETDGDGCLVVFDDVSDPDALRPFVPACGAARVLITSDRQSAASLGSSVPVEVFSLDQALTFLAHRTGLADAAEAAALAAELEYLPLALAQAAAVITALDLSFRRTWSACERCLCRST